MIDNALLQQRQGEINRMARYQGNSSGVRIQPQVQIDQSSELYKVSQEFEAIFIKQMLDVMRKTVNKSGLLDGGMAENIFEDMLTEERSKIMAKTAGFGLADTLYRQLASDRITSQQMQEIAELPQARPEASLD
jgi:flagellar protein FlgJ